MTRPANARVLRSAQAVAKELAESGAFVSAAEIVATLNSMGIELGDALCLDLQTWCDDAVTQDMQA